MNWSKKIVQITNTNAKVKEARHWKAVTSKEMKVFLAFLIISNGLVVLCRMSSIFYPPGVQRFFHTPNIRNLLSSQKWLFWLNNIFYFMDLPHVITEDERNNHLFKIGKVSSFIVSKCRTPLTMARKFLLMKLWYFMRKDSQSRWECQTNPLNSRLSSLFFVMWKADIARMLSFMLTKMMQLLV